MVFIMVKMLRNYLNLKNLVHFFNQSPYICWYRKDSRGLKIIKKKEEKKGRNSK